MGIRTVVSKMKKHEAMLLDPILLPHLPETHWFSISALQHMQDSYTTFFVKPVGGTGGKGIIRVRKRNKKYEVRLDNLKKKINEGQLYKTILYYSNPAKKYIIQQGIPLGTYHGSLFDLRIYLQKPDDTWIISGKVARVARPYKFVTNYHRGGHAKDLHKVLSELFSKDTTKIIECMAEIEKVSLAAANILSTRFPGLRTIGLDLGVEQNGHIWIIEANTAPRHYLFTKLKDKSMLDNILANKKLIKKRYA